RRENERIFAEFAEAYGQAFPVPDPEPRYERETNGPREREGGVPNGEVRSSKRSSRTALRSRHRRGVRRETRSRSALHRTIHQLRRSSQSLLSPRRGARCTGDPFHIRGNLYRAAQACV